MDRNEAIARIRKALKQRSGINWSVTGGRGTAWGWIRISAPPSRCKYVGKDKGTDAEGRQIVECHFDASLASGGGSMGLEDARTLHKLLELDEPRFADSVSIPASSEYRQEYVDRAEGRTPSVIGKPYWD